MDENTATVDVNHRYTDQAEGPLKELLARRVPISLIMDLAMPAGPHSRELLEAEGSPDDAWWEQP